MTDQEQEFIDSGRQPITLEQVNAATLNIMSRAAMENFYGPSPLFFRLTRARPAPNPFPMMNLVPHGKTLDRAHAFIVNTPRLVRSRVWQIRHRLADRLERIADRIGG